MARFYGEVAGSARTTASRQGTKGSGISAHIRGWNIGARVRMYVNEDGNDTLVLSITGGSNHPNETKVVYQDEYGKEQYLNVGQEYHLVLDKPRVVLEFDK